MIIFISVISLMLFCFYKLRNVNPSKQLIIVKNILTVLILLASLVIILRFSGPILSVIIKIYQIILFFISKLISVFLF